MNTSPMMNVMKGVAIGMTAGVCMGIVGKNMVDSNPKLKKKANKAFKTMESVLDTAQYMFRWFEYIYYKKRLNFQPFFSFVSRQMYR